MWLVADQCSLPVQGFGELWMEKAAHGADDYLTCWELKYSCTVNLVELQSVLVRTQLEHCAQFWSLLYKNDVDRLESVQRRATGMGRGLAAPM